jgi:phosphoribosylformylglycinamidine cyclo-ligase
VMADGRFDLAGFCVGVVEEPHMLGPRRVTGGDALVGLASSGLHSNGYSLVRRALLEEGGYDLDDELPRLGRSLAEELLEPTAIYAPLVRSLASDGLVHAAAHITGGGLVENVPRALPEGLGATIHPGTWTPPPVFDLVAEAAGASRDDMFATFNMGVGMVLVVPEGSADDVIARAGARDTLAWRIGQVTAGVGVDLRA